MQVFYLVLDCVDCYRSALFPLLHAGDFLSIAVAEHNIMLELQD